jgi:PglZ domain
MNNSFIEYIVSYFNSFDKKIILVENPDKFLLREDIIKILEENNISIVNGNGIEQRIKFELKSSDKTLIFTSEDNENYLEDIQRNSFKMTFHLSNYIKGYDTSSVVNAKLDCLEILFLNPSIKSLSKAETENYLNSLFPKEEFVFNYVAFERKINILLECKIIDWLEIINEYSNALLLVINTKYLKDVIAVGDKINICFQKELEQNFKHLFSSSAIKKPKIVSKILDHINHNHKTNKIALIVIDGMGFWQYNIIKSLYSSSLNTIEDFTFSWLPSITQLSRQAIFKGDYPDKEYIQNPKNEEKLWENYWTNKGLDKFEIRYNHDKIDTSNLERITKFAIVLKDLDDKMHSSTDYTDLKGLTQNWIERSEIIKNIEKLIESGFEVFITSDHGNILTNGWRGLNSREKLGTNKSGSRSQRHIEYTDQILVDEFLVANPEIQQSVVRDNNAIYFKNNYNFSSKDSVITHGGSHFLEVIIPFIKILKK